MSQNVNSNVIANGRLFTINGVECVFWRGGELMTLEVDELTEISDFADAVHNGPDFMAEWARNRYPLYAEGWLFDPVAAHLEDSTGVCAVTFVINNSVSPFLEGTYGILTLSRQSDGKIYAELTDK